MDSQFDTMSFRTVDETICPSSTKIAALVEIFSTVTAKTPSLVVMLSVSSTDQVFRQLLGWPPLLARPTEENMGAMKTTSSETTASTAFLVETISEPLLIIST